MKTITVRTKRGINYSYNDKDYPKVDIDQNDKTISIYYKIDGYCVRTLLLIPIIEIVYIKFKYTDK